jgi:hypothetical protein
MSFCIGKNADFIAVRNAEGSVLRVSSLQIADPLINTALAVPSTVLESGATGDIQFNGDYLEVHVYNGPDVPPQVRYLALYNYVD